MSTHTVSNNFSLPVMLSHFFYVYILKSLKDGHWYIGFTTNLDRRFTEHNTGQNTSTRNRIPFELIYFEGYVNEKDARGRELFLKSGSGHTFLKRQMRNYLEE